MANERTGGLDAVGAPSTVDNAVQGAAQGMTGGGLGGANINIAGKGAGIGAGKSQLSPTQTNELLANMQEMIAQKTGGWNQFMSGLQDAAAWAVPGIGGQKALALQGRNEAKRQEAQDVFSMRQQMAAAKSQSEQAQAQRAAMNQILGGGGEGGAGGTGGVSVPPEVRAEMAMDPANAPAILQNYLKTVSTKRLDAQGNVQGSYYIPAVKDTVNMTPNEYLQYQATGKLPPGVGPATAAPSTPAAPTQPQVAPSTGGVNQFNLGNVRPAGASTGFQQPKSYEEGIAIMDKNLQAYGNKGVDTLRGVISRWAPPNENQTDALIKTASQRLGLNPDQKIDLSNPAIRQAVGTAIMLQEKGPKGIFGAPQQAVSAGAAPKNKEEAEQQRKLQLARGESDIAVSEAGLKELSKQEGEKRAEFVKSLSTADQTFTDLEKLLNASKGQKQVFNLAGKGAVGPLAGSALQKFGFGDKTDENKNDTIARNLLPEDKQSAYNQIKTGAAVAQANFGKNLVEGAGGKLTNADLTLGKIAKGMGTEQTYDSHMFNLAKSMEAARTVYYRAQAFEKWQAEHPNEPISKFETSPEYKTDAKVRAAMDVAAKVADVPELAGKFVHKDANGRPYVTVNGKSYYVGGGAK